MAPGGPDWPASSPGASPAPSGGFGAGSPSQDPGWGKSPPHRPPDPPRTAVQLALIGGGIVIFLGALASAAVILWVLLRSGPQPVQVSQRPPPTLEVPTVAMAPPIPPPAAAEDERPTFGAKHLLVMYKGSKRAPDTITRTKPEARERAAEAQRKAQKKGADFGAIVREYSDEPGAAKRDGDLGTFRKGMMVPEFQDAVEAIEVGQISDVVETQFGYHVILRTK
jgi:PPIC-type PPIASE domain